MQYIYVSKTLQTIVVIYEQSIATVGHNKDSHSRRGLARGGGAPDGDDDEPTQDSRGRRREQSPSTYPALFLRGGGAASVLPGRTPTQHMEDGATTPTFFVSGSGRPCRTSTP